MSFPLYLAVRNLLRHPGRNVLYVLGISITAALLLDMVLLSSGLSISLERVLKDMGYEIRIAPRGTLPFETDAHIEQYRLTKSQLVELPGVSSVDAMLGASVMLERGNETFTSFAMGLDLSRPVLYRITEGSDLTGRPDEILINTSLAREKQIHTGDRLLMWTTEGTQSTGVPEPHPMTVAGIAYFYLDAEGQYSVAMPLDALQRITAVERDPVSAIMIKLQQPSEADALTERMNNSFLQLSAYTIPTVLKEVDAQLSYFKQFAYILGGISMVVTFVLVFIITTISFHDRLGEVALLKAMGLSHRTIFSTILLEGILTALAAAFCGFLLGKVVAIYLDAILTSAPGLPEGFSFFVLEPSAVLRAGVILLMTGFFAGLYPAAAAVRLPIAQTLREEIL